MCSFMPFIIHRDVLFVMETVIAPKTAPLMCTFQNESLELNVYVHDSRKAQNESIRAEQK